jgi:ketosteroid isomerase-like protein
MSQENVAIVRALHEAVAEGGLDAAREFMHSDFEMSQLPLHPGAGTYRGGRAAAESMESWIGTLDEFRWEAEEFIDAGDRVVVVVRERGRVEAVELFSITALALCTRSETARSRSFSGSTTSNRPRSRGPLGVGDVAGERRGRPQDLRRNQPQGRGCDPKPPVTWMSR